MSDTLRVSGANDTAHRAEPGAPPSGARPSRVLMGAGLLAVAVIAGFAWWLIRHEPEPVLTATAPTKASTAKPPDDRPASAPTTVDSGEFTFGAAVAPDAGRDCVTVSYGQVRDWFRDHPCERVVRGLYTTNKTERALVSIIVVTMPSAERAQDLKSITDTSGTGNVSDMLRDGSAHVPGAPDVAGESYASDVTGRNVTVVEAAFFDGYRNRSLLDEISAEALRMATRLR